MKSTKTKHGTLYYKPLGKGHFELTLYDIEADEEATLVDPLRQQKRKLSKAKTSFTFGCCLRSNYAIH